MNIFKKKETKMPLPKIYLDDDLFSTQEQRDDKLKEKGLLIIAVPNPTSHDAKHYKEFWAAYDVPRHIYHFSKNGMENLISKKSNWKLRKIKPLIPILK